MTEKGRFLRRKAGDKISSADLLRECGRRLTDGALWQEFQGCFQKLILSYLIRALRLRNIEDDLASLVDDLAQDVYVRLVRNEGRILRGFKGNTDFSVAAFLARISMSVVSDYCRREFAGKRQGAEMNPTSNLRHFPTQSAATVDMDVSTILSWIDVQRLMESDPDRRNAARNVLMFKLHCIDGFSCAEIARFPAFNLNERTVQVVLQDLKARLQNNKAQ